MFSSSEPDAGASNYVAESEVDDLNADHILHLQTNEINEINNLDDPRNGRFQM